MAFGKRCRGFRQGHGGVGVAGDRNLGDGPCGFFRFRDGPVQGLVDGVLHGGLHPGAAVGQQEMGDHMMAHAHGRLRCGQALFIAGPGVCTRGNDLFHGGKVIGPDGVEQGRGAPVLGVDSHGPDQTTAQAHGQSHRPQR